MVALLGKCLSLFWCELVLFSENSQTTPSDCPSFSHLPAPLFRKYRPNPAVLPVKLTPLNGRWKQNTVTRLQVFNSLIGLVTSCGNYSQYRKRFSECLGFRFPILGVHLKDLIAVHVALPDWADKEKTRVNLTKTQQLYTILQELALIQNTPPNIDANTDLVNLLTVLN